MAKPVTCPCGNPGRRANGGLCDKCLDAALREVSKEIAARRKKKT